jgi:hypothetical protein
VQIRIQAVYRNVALTTSKSEGGGREEEDRGDMIREVNR